MARRNLKKLTVPELFLLWSETLAELRARDVIRSANSPISDYAEFLVAQYYGVPLEPKSNRGFDLRTPDGEQIEVKALRRTQRGRSNLSRLGDLNHAGFDALVIVAFNLDCSSWEAWHVPLSAVKRHAGYSKAWKGPRLSLTRTLVRDPEVTALEIAALRT